MTEATLAGLVILFIVVVWFRLVALESERLMAELLKVSTGLLDKVQQLESYHERTTETAADVSKLGTALGLVNKALEEDLNRIQKLEKKVDELRSTLTLMSTLSREDKHAHTGRDPGEGQVVSSEADTGTSSS